MREPPVNAARAVTARLAASGQGKGKSKSKSKGLAGALAFIGIGAVASTGC